MSSGDRYGSGYTRVRMCTHEPYGLERTTGLIRTVALRDSSRQSNRVRNLYRNALVPQGQCRVIGETVHGDDHEGRSAEDFH